jgi:predicted phosphohydrolase
MNVWAISDLHLSFGNPERRDRYAARWRDHADKIERGWREAVRPGDVVLLPGDLSMARNHRELQPDLEWLEALPGTKVLAPGNHDRWWNDTDSVRRLLRRSMVAVGGEAEVLRGLIVCGTRGAPPLAEQAGADDRLAADRELEAISRALDHASRLRGDRDQPLYVLWHFPPFDAHGRPGRCVEMFERSRVTACVYGHLHIQGQWSLAVQGMVRGVRYHCVAADAIGFRPWRIEADDRNSSPAPRE